MPVIIAIAAVIVLILILVSAAPRPAPAPGEASAARRALLSPANFRVAGERAEETQGQTAVTGPISTAMGAAFQQDPTPSLPGAPGLDPMSIRLSNLNNSVGSSLVPGIDSREPAASTSIGSQVDRTGATSWGSRGGSRAEITSSSSQIQPADRTGARRRMMRMTQEE